MFWFFLMVVFAICGAIGAVCVIGSGMPARKLGIGASLGTMLGLMLLVTLFMSFHSVQSGHVGVVRQFGKIDGQIGSGLQFVAPWKSIDVADVQVQAFKFDNLDAFTKETQDVHADVTLNYHVSADAIQGLYIDVGSDYFDRLVPARVEQIFKDTTVQYNATDIAPNRESIRATVKTRLAAALAPYSIDVVDVLINNIGFSKQFTQSIEQKQIQSQQSLRAQQKVQQAQYEAEQAVATAQGNAKATLVQAEGQAKANRVLTHSLTPLLVRYQAIQKFNPNVQIALIPSGNGSLIDPSTFLQGLGTAH